MIIKDISGGSDTVGILEGLAGVLRGILRSGGECRLLRLSGLLGLVGEGRAMSGT